jgi:putative DNA primase/helicase
MPAADLIAALGGNPHSGMCLCPAHEDATPSLKVSEQNGKVLVHCFAGCPQETVISRLKELGLWNKTASMAKPTAKSEYVNPEQEAYEKFRRALSILRAAGNDPVGSPAAYLKGRGIELIPPSLTFMPPARAAKLQDKIPSLKHTAAMVAPIIGAKGLQGALVTYLTRDGTKNLKENKKNIRHTYGALKGGYIQLGTIDPNKPPKKLFVGEGIETALSPAHIVKYHPAIAVPGGNFRDITPPPAEELIILADNDENGGGLKKAREAGVLWARHGRSVRIALAPDPYNDWNDALCDPKADRNELRRLLLNAEPVEPRDYEVRALTMAELMDRNFPPREQLLPPWLATSSLAMIHAQRGAGKTRFAMSVAYTVAAGTSMLDWHATRSRRVLYVDGELQATQLQLRVKVLGAETPNLLLLSRDILMREGRMTIPDLAMEEGRAFLDEIIGREKIELIILDSLSTLMRSGVENDAESWAPIQDWLLQHRFHSRTVIIIHHEGRSGKPRGTSKREDVLDTIIRLEAIKDDDAVNDDEVTFGLTFTKTREFYGAEAAPLRLHLSTKLGTANWTHELQRDHVHEHAKKLQKDGLTQKEIAKELGLTQGRVSQILSYKA